MAKSDHSDHSDRIDRVYLIFKTHLDLGFTDSAAAVERSYFEEFIPSAIQAGQTAQRG